MTEQPVASSERAKVKGKHELLVRLIVTSPLGDGYQLLADFEQEIRRDAIQKERERCALIALTVRCVPEVNNASGWFRERSEIAKQIRGGRLVVTEEK